MTLKGEIQEVIQSLDTMKLHRREDIEFRQMFRKRFAYDVDSTDYSSGIPASLKPLYKIFQQYWRASLLEKHKNHDSQFKADLLQLLKMENKTKRFTDSIIDESGLEHLYADYIHSKGFNTTDYGKTGFLYDLIVWKTMTDNTYLIALIDDTVDVKVNFIDDFISLGWLAYARLGKTSPGGWATKKELYCVLKGYDTTSEKFLLSYLKHEGQHFSDYQRYGELPPADLEYRAKLQELYFSEQSINTLIQTFIAGAKYDSTNSHPFANYCLIRDMSGLLFNKDFESDLSVWKKLPSTAIRRAAAELFAASTDKLRKGVMLR